MKLEDSVALKDLLYLYNFQIPHSSSCFTNVTLGINAAGQRNVLEILEQVILATTKIKKL